MERNDRSAGGRVWLVGAGPGDAGLLTLRGRDVLSEAQTVVYDALAGDGVLSMIPEGAEQIYVGKRGGNHAMTQEEINALLVEKARAGRRLVRLKGGDPFVFGRGSEEAEALRQNGIPFEVVPGVTSAVSVPAYYGIPVTHRGLASSFYVITGHLKNGEPIEPDYEALVKSGGTLIFLMGVSSAEEICEGLMRAGMAGTTPAAFLQEGTTAGQKKVISVLASLTEDGRRAGIRPPAVMIVGEVCSLSETCHWAEERPLFGAKILVTRPVNRAAALADRLRREGAEVIGLPAVETRLLTENKELLAALQNLSAYDWLAFTSPSGVELFFEYMRERRMDLRSLFHLKIAVIGSGTGEELEKRGIYADYMPERFYAADLGEGLSERVKAGERLLILRAREASPELIKPLREKQTEYEDVPLYETVFPKQSPQTLRVKKMLREGQFRFVTFTSGSTVRGFLETLEPSPEELESFTAVCIGSQTAAQAEKAGMRCIVSQIPSMDSMTEVIAAELRGCR